MSTQATSLTTTVQRCRKDGVVYGPVHFAADASTLAGAGDIETICGSVIATDRASVVVANGHGEATCKGCLRAAQRDAVGQVQAETDNTPEVAELTLAADLPTSPDGTPVATVEGGAMADGSATVDGDAMADGNATADGASPTDPKPRITRGMGYDQAFRAWIADLLAAGNASAAEAVGDVLFALTSSGNKWFRGALDDFPSTFSPESGKTPPALKKSTPLAVVLRDHAAALAGEGRADDALAVSRLMDAMVARKMIVPPPAPVPPEDVDDYVRLCAFCDQWKRFDAGADEDGICDDCRKEYG